jgi:anti-anti-sigma factor
MLTVTVEDHANAVILHCRGRLVKGSETPLLCEAVHRYGQDISVDLSAVTAIDAAGLGALISLQAAGVYIRLLNPSKAVRELLHLTTADTLFDISQTEVPELESSHSQLSQTDCTKKRGLPFFSPLAAT